MNHPSSPARLLACCAILALAAFHAAAAETNSLYRAPETLRDLGKSHKVRLIYFLPADRQPTPNFEKKIAVVMSFVADLYQEDFKAKGYKGGVPDFVFNDGQLQISLLRSTNHASHYADTNINSSRQWPLISGEVERAFGSPSKNMYVVFAETYGDGPAKYEWPGGIALGARYSAEGGLGIFSAWILRNEFCATNIARQLEFLDDATPIQGRTALGHGRLNSPRFEFIEDGFGAVAHELGHAFGLPHDTRKDSQYIMGNGFRNLRYNFLKRYSNKPPVGFSPDNARLLRYSRFLGDTLNASDFVAPKLKLILPEKLSVGATNIPVSIECSDNESLGAVLYFSSTQDTVIGGADLEGKQMSLKQLLTVRPLKAGEYKLRATVSDRNGNHASQKGTIQIE